MYDLNDVLTKDFSEKNRESFEELKKRVKTQGLCFILGAGVGQSVGLPNWNELLSKAIGRLLYTFDRDNDILSMRECAQEFEKGKFDDGVSGKYQSVWDVSNPLEIAEYLLNYHQELLTVHSNLEVKQGIAEKQLLALIRSCLHHSKAEMKTLEKKYCKKVRNGERISTLKSIAETIKSHFDKEGTQTVITYNYDNLLEYSLVNKCNISSDTIKVISYKGTRDINDGKNDRQIEQGKINICHIHGYIDITENKNECDGLILSERSYRDVEQSEYNWINTCQAVAMQDHTCVLVGFSGEDYNFRRIVRKSNDGESYIFFSVNDIVKSIFSEEASKLAKAKGIKLEKAIDKILKDKKRCCYEKLMMAFWIYSKTMYWEKFNVHPIWTTLEDLPKRILELQ